MAEFNRKREINRSRKRQRLLDDIMSIPDRAERLQAIRENLDALDDFQRPTYEQVQRGEYLRPDDY